MAVTTKDELVRLVAERTAQLQTMKIAAKTARNFSAGAELKKAVNG